VALRLRQEQSKALRRATVAQGLVESLSRGGGKAEYDPRSGIIRVSDAMQRRRRILLDASGFVQEIQSASGRALKFTVDDGGRTTGIEEPSGQQVAFGYDADSQVTGVARNGVQLCRVAWSQDKSQCAISYWDGSVARAIFDTAGKPQQLTNRLNATDVLTYDSEGRLCELTNARGESTRFELNDDALPSTTIHPDGRSESVLSYDDMRNPTAVANNGELTFKATYSAPGCVTDLSYADGSEYHFVRDEKGRVLEASGPGSKTAFIYNAHGLPVEETTNGRTFRFEYDATNLLIAIEYPDGSRVSFTYDEDARILECTDWQGGSTLFVYDSKGREVTRRTPNGVTQYSRLHACGKPERLAVVGPQGSILADSQFSYDVATRLTTRVDSGGARRDFVYDAESQLLGVHSQQQWIEHYAYDLAGNRIASHDGAALVAPGNRIARHGADVYDYDARGNVSSAQIAGDFWRFEYDLRNQLVTAHGPRGPVRFEYDALGRRISKISEAERVQYVWCAEQLAQEIISTPEGVETRDYVYVPGTYQPLAMRSGKRCYYFHASHDGPPERISDSNGEVVWAARYEAFGQAHIEVEKIRSSFRFAGQHCDPETGLHYNRFRYYSPRLGRYWSVDPIGLRGEHNLYAYVGNDPINRVDPLGLWWKTALSIAAGVVAAVGVAALVVATAPVSLPALAIAAVAGTAGVAVGFGMNEALTADHFCASCLARGFVKGAAFGLTAVVGIALAAEVSATLATIATAGVIAYGLYSTANLVFHWDNMTHEQRMEAIGGALGGVAVGVFVGATGGGIPPEGPPGYAMTPEGVLMPVPATAAPAAGAGPLVGAAPAAAMSGSDDSGGSGETKEQRLARKKAELEANRQRKLEDEKAADEARRQQNREDGELKNQRGRDAEQQSLEDARNDPDRDTSQPMQEDEGAIRRDNDIPRGENGEEPKLPDHSYPTKDGKQRFVEVKNETATDAAAVQKKFETVSQSSKYPEKEYVLEMWEGGKFSDPAFSAPEGTLLRDGQPVTVDGQPIKVVTKPFPR